MPQKLNLRQRGLKPETLNPLFACGLALLCLFLYGGSVNAAEKFFSAGIEAYKAADYERAVNAFHQSVLTRPTAGGYQNLGLAEWQRSHVGPAIVAWEQSLWLNPFDRAVRNNLRFARKAAQLEAPELSWAEVISGWLPVNWWGWLLCSSAWLAIGASTLPTVLRVPRASWHQALGAFGVMVFLLCLPAQFGVHTRARLAFVLDKATPLRLTPTSEAEAITQLASGEPLRWVRARGDFILVRTSRSVGWLERRQIGFVCDQPVARP